MLSAITAGMALPVECMHAESLFCRSGAFPTDGVIAECSEDRVTEWDIMGLSPDREGGAKGLGWSQPARPAASG